MNGKLIIEIGRLDSVNIIYSLGKGDNTMNKRSSYLTRVTVNIFPYATGSWMLRMKTKSGNAQRERV